MNITENFRESEFACPCCSGSGSNINRVLVAKLQVLRSLLGDRPITVTSGYRCKKHNEKVGGSKNSLHMENKAADIVVSGLKPYQVYYYAEKVFATGGVGIYKGHVHVDVGKKNRWEG